MKAYHSKNWQILSVTGVDRIDFLHRLLTQDIKSLSTQQGAWSCLLTPKSKLIAFMFVQIRDDQVLLFMDDRVVKNVKTTLSMYAITEDVDIQPFQAPVYIVFDKNRIVVSETVEDDLTSLTFEAFEVDRVKRGFALFDTDYQDPIPLEVPFMHQAISFTKGCYVGQETIARLYARGMHVNRKLLQVKAQGLIAPSDPIYANGDEVGVITTAVNDGDVLLGLAWVHRNAFELDLTAGSRNIPIQVITEKG
ncbi:MAG: hypothetical protein KDD46_04775 [Bdellovibrionales bacterium]|nr:hypothetical protein [Bdellovibrionales bacterium]